MAATIKVDLDVDQAQFVAFYSAFQKFSKGLGDTQTKWKGVNDQMREAADASQEIVAAGARLQDTLEKSRQSLGALKPMTESIARGWASISVTTTRVAANLKDATLSLLRWSGIGGLIGGGVFGVGALGMGALGSSVTANRSAAMGLGTTYGRRQAFNIAFGRFGDAEGVMGRVSQQQSSADHTALRNLGLSPSEIANMDPAELAARAYQLLGERAGKVPRGQLKDWMHSNRIDEVFDIGQARQAIGATRSGEMGELQKAFGANKGRFEMSDEVTRGWARFSMHMEIAAGILKKVFAGALARLTPSLTKLSQTFTKLVEKLLADGGPIERGIDELAKWLDHVTKDLDEKKIGEWFQSFFDGIKDIVKSTGAFVKALADLLRWFGITPAHASTGGGGDMSTPGGEAIGSGGGMGGGTGGGGSGSVGLSGRAPTPGGGSVGHMGGGGATPAAGGSRSATPAARGTTPTSFGSGAVGSGADLKMAIDAAAARHHIDPHILYGIAHREGNPERYGDKYPVGDSGLSHSAFQYYTGGGLGNEMAKRGVDVRNPKSYDAIIDDTARRISQMPESSIRRTWHAYRGREDWNPKWGSMGYPTRTTVTVNKAPGNDAPAAANANARQTP